jgi:hypothetical protein
MCVDAFVKPTIRFAGRVGPTSDRGLGALVPVEEER